MVEELRIMARYRSILALILAVGATFMVSFSSLAATSKAATYTPAQIEQIQRYVPAIEEQRDRLQKLQTFIQKKNWVDVGTYIHGPLGQLRQDMNSLARTLSPEDQKTAREATKDLYGALVRIDQVAKEGNYQQAVSNYRLATKAFDTFLQLVPKA